MSVSVFEHPLLSGLLGDAGIAACFTLEAEIDAMLAFERALAEAEAAEGVIPTAAAAAIDTALAAFRPDIGRLREGTARDGTTGPELVRQLRAAVGDPHGESVHFGATSQDVVDTGLAIRLARVLALLRGRLQALVAALDAFTARTGAVATMAHTRMQAAIPVPASRKIASWRAPLARHLARLDAVEAGVVLVHFGGAAGTLDKLGAKGPAVRRRLAASLGLGEEEGVRHSERDGMAELAGFLSLVTGSLGKMGIDIALLAQSEVGEIRVEGGGGSSAMPHKANPVAAEALVTLARFNATLVSGMHHALVHEGERSGAAWMLEWMLLPQMAAAAGAATRAAEKLVSSISFVARDGP